MWGIIPAAGVGSRIQPLAFSKELLPVGGRVDGETERPRAVSEYLVDRMVWNEPNNKSHWDFAVDTGWHMFASMAKLAGAALKAERPGLPRVLGGMSPIDAGFLRNLEGQGVLEHVDYRHFYMGLVREDGSPKKALRHFADYTPTGR